MCCRLYDQSPPSEVHSPVDGVPSGDVSKYIPLLDPKLATDPNLAKPDRPILDNLVLDFNGVDQYANTGLTMKNTDTSIEVAGWFFPSETSDTRIAFSAMHSNNDDFRLISTSSTWQLQADDGSVDTLTTTLPCDLQQWVYVEFGIKDGEMYFRYNGANEVTLSTTFNFATITDGRISLARRITDGLNANCRWSGVNINNEHLYPLQGNGLDAYGNASPLTLVNAPQFVIDNSAELADADRVNEVGYTVGRSFNGVDQYGYLDVNQVAFPFSLEATAVNTESAAARAIVGVCSSTNGSRYYNIQIDPDDRIVITRRSVEDGTSTHTTATTLNGFHAIKVIFHNSTTFDVYQDGVVIESVVSSDSVRLDDLTSGVIGSLRILSPTNLLQGSIADAKIDGVSIDLSDESIMVGNPEQISIPANEPQDGTDCLGNPLTYGPAYPHAPVLDIVTGAYDLRVTEGGNRPPAFGNLPDTWTPGDSETDYFFWRENGDGTYEKFLGFLYPLNSDQKELVYAYQSRDSDGFPYTFPITLP